MSDRNSQGKFTKRNRAAIGHRNPTARRAQVYKLAILESVSGDDIKAIIERLKGLALQGDIQAAREILDRTAGKPKDTDPGGFQDIIEIEVGDDLKAVLNQYHPGESAVDAD